MRRTHAVLAVVALAVLASAAVAVLQRSGGGEALSRAEYRQRATPVFRALADRIAVDAAAIGAARDAAQAAPRLASLSRAFFRAADGFQNLAPPQEARAAHEALVDALRGLGARLDQLAVAARAGGTGRLREAQEELNHSADARQFQHALGELRTGGYLAAGY